MTPVETRQSAFEFIRSHVTLSSSAARYVRAACTSSSSSLMPSHASLTVKSYGFSERSERAFAWTSRTSENSFISVLMFDSSGPLFGSG